MSDISEYQYRWAEKYLELADVTVGRREELNKMFLIANSGLLAIESYVGLCPESTYSSVCLSGLGIGLCFIWMLISNYYSNIMKAKGQVIRQIEDHLQVDFWQAQGKAKGADWHHSLSSLEIIMSTPFFALHVFFAFGNLGKLDLQTVGPLVMTLVLAYIVTLFALWRRAAW
ncbi:MAG: hypothetical protein AAGA91_19930 [Pseudomonadota bacterium]